MCFAHITPLKTTLAKTPIDRSPVANITMLELSGCDRRFLIEAQLKVLIDTMIITATKAAIGICLTHLP